MSSTSSESLSSERSEHSSDLNIYIYIFHIYLHVNKIYRHIKTAVLAVRMSHVRRTSTHRSLLSDI